MPTVAISSECHKAIKQYLLDVDNYDIGQFIEDAVFFAMDHLEEFEEAIGMEEDEDEEEGEDVEDVEDVEGAGDGETGGPGGGVY